MPVKDIVHRQVIVVGAGPAGSAAAQRLAEAGLDVLVLERRSIGGIKRAMECERPLWLI